MFSLSLSFALQARFLTAPFVLLALLAAIVVIARSGGHSDSPTALFTGGIGEEEVIDNAAKTATKQGSLEIGITPFPVDPDYLNEVGLTESCIQVISGCRPHRRRSICSRSKKMRRQQLRSAIEGWCTSYSCEHAGEEGDWHSLLHQGSVSLQNV
eukprot:752989-Hanusia_phi.AAC.2